ncbi:MAG: hypothetical protein LBT33_11105, partial [Spirochaetia bacterium]|nr:hypothetical protein [Spirochaetia bacterium]
MSEDPAKQYVRNFILSHGVVEDRRGFISCLWHSEKTPSMSLEPHGENYHCFGCHKSADVYDFAARFYGLDVQRDFLEIKNRVYGELGLGAPGSSLPAPKKPAPVSIAPD